MKRATWKKSERECAEALGGKRVPVTGRGRGDVPDVEHPWLAIEHKAGRVLSSRLQVALEQAKAAAVGTDKLPIVTIDHSRPSGNIKAVLLAREDFIRWFVE